MNFSKGQVLGVGPDEFGDQLIAFSVADEVHVLDGADFLGVLGAGHEHDPFGHQVVGADIFTFHRGHHDAEVQAAGLDLFDDFTLVIEIDVQRDVRILLFEIEKQPHEGGLTDLGEASERKRSVKGVGLFLGRGEVCLDFLDQGRERSAKFTAMLRQMDVVPVSSEELNAELLFQEANLARHGGLGDAKRLSGIGEAQRVGKADETLQEIEIDIHSGNYKALHPKFQRAAMNQSSKDVGYGQNSRDLAIFAGKDR